MRAVLNINKSLRNTVLNDWDDSNVLGFHFAANKEIYMLAVALGLDCPEDITTAKEGYIRTENQTIKSYDRSLFASILLGTVVDETDIDKYANIEVNYDESERCAEAGFKKLTELIDDVNGDWELLEKRLMSQMNLLYEKNVNNK